MVDRLALAKEKHSPLPRRFTFDFVRATNLESPAAGHMGQLVLTVKDHDHFTQEWSWMENGKVAHRQVFHFTRKS